MMGVRIGQNHGRAKLTDHDVDLVRELLDDRKRLIRELRCQGVKPGVIDNVLTQSGMSFRCIALKFEVSKSLVRAIGAGRVRIWAQCTTGGREPVGLGA
jgi:hypothetical protein